MRDDFSKNIDCNRIHRRNTLNTFKLNVTIGLILTFLKIATVVSLLKEVKGWATKIIK